MISRVLWKKPSAFWIDHFLQILFSSVCYRSNFRTSSTLLLVVKTTNASNEINKTQIKWTHICKFRHNDGEDVSVNYVERLEYNVEDGIDRLVCFDARYVDPNLRYNIVTKT